MEAGVDAAFLRRFEESFAGGMEAVLAAMGMARDELEEAMRATGEIRAVVVDGEDAGSIWLELRDRTLHLHALLLDLAFRERGIGTRVLGMIEDEYRGRADELELGVQRGNDAAEHLYEATGFSEVESPHAELGFRVLRRRLDS
ncbi:MAG TPA: GNAT family N-acetyltransferase [Gaiellaceae bacterium]|nr:GNAT family N-acetyltransferase [Gaiellaceae bacterium]